MAILEAGIMGPITNKIGGYVSAKWKGINYVRSYVVPSNPQTPAQTANRTRFGAVVGIAKKLLVPILRPFWDPFYPKMSGFNAFVKDAMSTFDVNNEITANTFISKGELEPIVPNTCTYNASTGEVSLIWDIDTFTNGLPTDQVNVVIYNKAVDKFFYFLNTDPRSTGFTYPALDLGINPSDLIVYIFTSRGSSSDLMVSDSVGNVATA